MAEAAPYETDDGETMEATREEKANGTSIEWGEKKNG